jgi:heme O synthase-like polyprenyltransferase
LVWLSIRFASTRSESSARALFLGSITYLPLLWIAMIFAKL